MVSSKRGSASAGSAEKKQEAGKTERSNELELQQLATLSDVESQVSPPASGDAFGNEEGVEVQYKTCAWW
mgnify:CR=1 FL=1